MACFLWIVLDDASLIPIELNARSAALVSREITTALNTGFRFCSTRNGRVLRSVLLIDAIAAALSGLGSLDAIVDATFVFLAFYGSLVVTRPLANGSFPARLRQTFVAHPRESWFCATSSYLITNHIEISTPVASIPTRCAYEITTTQVEYMLQLVSKRVAE